MEDVTEYTSGPGLMHWQHRILYQHNDFVYIKRYSGITYQYTLNLNFQLDTY